MFAGIGAAAKGVQGGRVVTTTLRIVAHGVDPAIAGIRTVQAFLALKRGDRGDALAYLGEATLMMLGVSVEAISAIRASRKALDEARAVSKNMIDDTWKKVESGFVDVNQLRMKTPTPDVHDNMVRAAADSGCFVADTAVKSIDFVQQHISAPLQASTITDDIDPETSRLVGFVLVTSGALLGTQAAYQLQKRRRNRNVRPTVDVAFGVGTHPESWASQCDHVYRLLEREMDLLFPRADLQH